MANTDWNALNKAFNSAYDKSVQSQQRREEQRRYDTQQNQVMFENNYNKAVSEWQSAVNQYQIASSQIGPENPKALASIQKKFNQQFKIPRKDGTFETRTVVDSELINYTSDKAKTKSSFDNTLDMWDSGELTNEQKIKMYPELKRNAALFGTDISNYEVAYTKALAFNDNKELLTSMKQFVPEGYDSSNWDLLLKDGVSDAELQLIAQDVNKNIATEAEARKYWQDFNTKIMEARSKLKLDSPATLVEELSRLQQIAQSKLAEYYFPDKTESPSEEDLLKDKTEAQEKANTISQEIFNKPFDELTPSQQDEIAEVYQMEKDKKNQIQTASIGPSPEPEESESLVDEEKGTIEVKRVGSDYMPNMPFYNPMQRTTTPEEEGYVSMEAMFEDKFQGEDVDFKKRYFNNDYNQWKTWFKGTNRKAESLPIPIPKKTSDGEKWVRRQDGRKFSYDKTVDPLNERTLSGKELQKKIAKNKVSYANKGIISKEQWPFWERVGQKKARSLLRKK